MNIKNIFRFKKWIKTSEDGEKRVKLSTLIYAILSILVFLVMLGSILAYGTNTEIGQKIAAKMSKIVPFPAAFVGFGNPIYLSDVQDNMNAIETFYQTQNLSQEGLRVDFTTEQGKKRLQIKEREILDKLVENKIIEVLAKKKNISVSSAEVDSAVNAKLQEYGTTDDVKDELLKTYGWSLEDFKKQVVLPAMYQEKLTADVMTDDSKDKQAQQQAEQAQKELQNGKDFAGVARTYSSGSSKENGGELGWVKKEQMLSELQDALFGDSQFKKDDIVESSIGYHIIEIEDKKKDGDEDVLRLRQIFIPKYTFADWLDEQKKQMHVIIPLKGFKWDASAGSVAFSDQQMTTFETQERANAQGDASIMF